MLRQFPPAAVFTIIERGLEPILPRGGARCSKGMRKMDRAFRVLETAKDAHGVNEAARAFLRARCGVCRTRCGRPLQ